jgi:hypothetical protein
MKWQVKANRKRRRRRLEERASAKIGAYPGFSYFLLAAQMV